MYSLIYVSSASSVFTAEDLQRLSEVSAENNQRDGITGALISKEGTFMQVLEGDESAVLATFARITLDSRHRGVITMLRREIPERQFPDWSMWVEMITATSPVSEPSGEFAKVLRATSQSLDLQNPSALLLQTFAGLRSTAAKGAQRR
jgi:hypothetical protein